MCQEAPGDRRRVLRQIGRHALRDEGAATLAGTRADVDDVVGAADGVLVVLHHHQGIALARQPAQRLQQDRVVAWMQADGGLVQHVAHPLQVAAELSGQPDALCLAAAQRGRGAVQRQVAQAHFFEKFEPAADLGHHVAGDGGVAANEGQVAGPLPGLVDGPLRHRGDGVAVEADVARDRVQPRALAIGAGFTAEALDVGLFRRKALLAALLVVVLDRVVQRLALFTRQRQAGAHAAGAPAVLAVVAEHARVQLGVAGAALRAGAFGREHLQSADAGRGRPRGHGLGQAVQRRQQVQHALAQIQRLGQQLTQLGFLGRADHQIAHRQLQRVLLEAVETRPGVDLQELAIHPQMGVATRLGPLGQVGIDTLAVDHQRRQQAHMLAAVPAQQLRGDALHALRAHLGAVVHAALRAQLHPQQAQEVPDLGGGGHGALAPAAAQPLLDRHRRRNAVDRIHLGPARWLHDAAGVGVEAFQVAPLPLVEQDVEGQRALARARHAGDHAELATRDVDVEALEVVLLRVDDADVMAGGQPGRVAPGLGDQLQRPAFFDGQADAQRFFVVAQRLAGKRAAMRLHVLGRAVAHQFTAGVAALGPEVDDPVGAADHVEVVLDDDQRVAGVQQFAQAAHQLGDVVEVQAGGGLVEQEQRALAQAPWAAIRRPVPRGERRRSGAARRAARRRLVWPRCGIGQKARQLQPLGLTAAQRGHRLAQPHVVQPHVDDGLQPRGDGGVAAEHDHRLGDGQLQHVGHAQLIRPAGELDLQQLGAEALAVAIGAAQVHVAEELHLHMLEARAAAGGAAAVAGVEAELAGGVVPLHRQRRVGKQLADLVEGADVAGRVAARGLADGALVDEHRLAQPIHAQQRIVLAGAFGGFAEVAQQRRHQHVLHQRALARAADARHDRQPLQRKADLEVLQVVLTHALQDQLGRRLVDEAAQPDAHVLARTQVGASQRVGIACRVGRAVEDDLPTALARAGAHVDQPVGGQHHRRIVLHHHQRIAGVAQPVHGLDDAVHVARVQADAGLVQHEQGVDQAGAQRGGQVDALHLAAAQRAALPVQREVAQAHVAQVTQAGAHLVEQQLQRFVEHGRRQGQAIKKAPQPVDRHQHQVVQAQARQRFELLTRPGHAHRHEAPGGRHHAIGIGLVAQPPLQRLQLQPRTTAAAAGRVTAVLRQEHADVHLVGLALQVAEEAAHAVPLLVPVAGPVGVAGYHPVALGLRKLAPGGVARDAGLAGVLQQVVLAIFPGGGLDRLDRAVAQRLAVVGDHQAHVDADHPAEAAAGLAGAEGRVEAEQRRLRIGITQVAVGAVQAGGITPQVGVLAVVFQRINIDATAAALEAQLDRLDHADLVGAGQTQPVGHDVQHLALVDDALGLHPGEAAGRQPLLDFGRRHRGRQLHRESDHQPWITAGSGLGQQVGMDGLGRVVPHGLCRLPVEQLGGAGEQQLQVVVQLGHRADRAAAGAHRVGLVDGDGRRHAVDTVDRRAVHAVEKLPRVGAEGLDIAPLAFGVQRVEHQAALARAAGPGDHRHLAGAQVEIEVLQVVLARTADADQAGGGGVRQAITLRRDQDGCR